MARNSLKPWFLAALLSGCAAPVAPPLDRCEDPAVHDLVSSVLTIDLACDEVSPQTREERERIVTALMSEFRECFARFQGLNAEIRSEAKAAAEAIRRASQPPESTTCTDFRARVERLRKLTGR